MRRIVREIFAEPSHIIYESDAGGSRTARLKDSAIGC